MVHPMATTEPISAADAAVYRSAKIRRAIYIATAVISILLTYGKARNWPWVDEPELAAWGSIVALVNGLAAFNVQTGPRV
jgi:hypothetical protein